MRMDILYQFNEKYVPYAGVSITSLLENNKKADELWVHIITEDVSEKSKRILAEIFMKYNRNYVFYDAKEIISKMKKLGIPAYRESYATNFKMFFPEKIDLENRLLYIDSDTLVLGDLCNLFEINMYGKPIAMALDSLGNRHKLLIGMKKEQLYYNAGVILFDLKEWRRRECTKKIVDHVQEVRAHYMAPDQDLLNIVLGDCVFKLNVEYNFQPLHYCFEAGNGIKAFGQEGYYTVKEIEYAKDNLKIVHFFRFLGQFPWHKDSLHPYTSLYDEYVKLTPWSAEKKQKTEQTGIVFRIERWLFQYLPRNLFLAVFKVNYEIFLRNANKASKKNRNSRAM